MPDETVPPGKPAQEPALTPEAERALKEAAERRAAQEAEVAAAKEFKGRKGPEPVRYGDWEVKGIVSDF
jgi:hypothetical protein